MKKVIIPLVLLIVIVGVGVFFFNRNNLTVTDSVTGETKTYTTSPEKVEAVSGDRFYAKVKEYEKVGGAYPEETTNMFDFYVKDGKVAVYQNSTVKGSDGTKMTQNKSYSIDGKSILCSNKANVWTCKNATSAVGGIIGLSFLRRTLKLNPDEVNIVWSSNTGTKSVLGMDVACGNVNSVDVCVTKDGIMTSSETKINTSSVNLHATTEVISYEVKDVGDSVFALPAPITSY